jgi:hypothetical protein
MLMNQINKNINIKDLAIYSKKYLFINDFSNSIY